MRLLTQYRWAWLVFLAYALVTLGAAIASEWPWYFTAAAILVPGLVAFVRFGQRPRARMDLLTTLGAHPSDAPEGSILFDLREDQIYVRCNGEWRPRAEIERIP